MKTTFIVATTNTLGFLQKGNNFYSHTTMKKTWKASTAEKSAFNIANTHTHLGNQWCTLKTNVFNQFRISPTIRTFPLLRLISKLNQLHEKCEWVSEPKTWKNPLSRCSIIFNFLIFLKFNLFFLINLRIFFSCKMKQRKVAKLYICILGVRISRCTKTGCRRLQEHKTSGT